MSQYDIYTVKVVLADLQKAEKNLAALERAIKTCPIADMILLMDCKSILEKVFDQCKGE